MRVARLPEENGTIVIINSSDAHNAFVDTEKRHLEVFQLPSLWFWLVSQNVRAVHVCRPRA